VLSGSRLTVAILAALLEGEVLTRSGVPRLVVALPSNLTD